MTTKKIYTNDELKKQIKKCKKLDKNGNLTWAAEKLVGKFIWEYAKGWKDVSDESFGSVVCMLVMDQIKFEPKIATMEAVKLREQAIRKFFAPD